MAISINTTAVDPAAVARTQASGRQRPTTDDDRTGTRTTGEPSSATAPALLGTDVERIVSGNNTVEVSFDDSIRRVVIKVKSEADGEVVKQIPPEEYQRFLAKLKEMIGVLFDEKV